MANRLECKEAHELLRIAAGKLHLEGFVGLSEQIRCLAVSMHERKVPPNAPPSKLPLRFLYDDLKKQYKKLEEQIESEGYKIRYLQAEDHIAGLEEEVRKLNAKIKLKYDQVQSLASQVINLRHGEAIKDKNKEIGRLKKANADLVAARLQLERKLKKYQENEQSEPNTQAS